METASGFGFEFTNCKNQELVEGLNATYFTNQYGQTIIHEHIMMVYWTAFDWMKKRMLDSPDLLFSSQIYCFPSKSTVFPPKLVFSLQNCNFPSKSTFIFGGKFKFKSSDRYFWQEIQTQRSPSTFCTQPKVIECVGSSAKGH